ncbi:MAG: hypothetical protein M0Z41_03850 [Peptococcaceae bacterium]|jgi:uncharacterized membrane protein YeaQ/YmgE (transglycosylase-associated protein family)|nr:hypothetical protein [Peptococcaceae bacterium]
MLHLIAFVVIGLVIGWWFSRGAGKPVMAVVLGLVGGLVGGYAVIYLVRGHYTIDKYGSLIASIVLALILAAAGRGGSKA